MSDMLEINQNLDRQRKAASQSQDFGDLGQNAGSGGGKNKGLIAAIGLKDSDGWGVSGPKGLFTMEVDAFGMGRGGGTWMERVWKNGAPKGSEVSPG